MGRYVGAETTLYQGRQLPWLSSGDVRHKAHGVTLRAASVVADGNGNKIVPSGTVVGKRNDGLYEPVVKAIGYNEELGTSVLAKNLIVVSGTGADAGVDENILTTANSLDSRGYTAVEYDALNKLTTIHLENNGAAIQATAAEVVAAIIAGATRATVTVGSNNAKVKVTAREAGFGGNLISLVLQNSGVSQSLAVTVVDDHKIAVTLGTSAVGAAVAASKLFFTGVSDKAFTVTAKAAGTAGNDISVALVDPSANSQSLTVNYDDGVITVLLATNSGGTITSTIAQVVAAINADYEAKALVTAALAESGSGSATATADAGGALTGGAAASGTGTVTSTAAQVIAAINANREARELVYAEDGASSNGTGTAAAVGETYLAGGNDEVPLTAANATGSDGSGAFVEIAQQGLTEVGAAQNVVAKFITAEPIDLKVGDGLVDVLDRARVRPSMLATSCDATVKAQLAAAGFTIDE